MFNNHINCCWEFVFQIFFSFNISFGVTLNRSEHGTSRPPCGRSAEYLLWPVTVQVILPLRRRNSEHTLVIFIGKCPTIVPSLFTATAFLSEALRYRVLIHKSTPHLQLPPILLYIRGSRGHNSVFRVAPPLSLVISTPELLRHSIKLAIFFTRT